MKEKIAVLSDIHGNSLALEAVLDDISRRGVDTIFNLGDSLYGPLDPVGTAEILMEQNMVHIMGNCDRMLMEPDQESPLTEEHLNWLQQYRATFVADDLLFCHGTPDSDEVYLLEEMTEEGGQQKSPVEIMETLQNVEQSVILCGHTHVPRVVYLPNGKMVVNQAA